MNFNKVILGKTESEKIFLKNVTAVMIYFEFEVDDKSEFRLSTFNGYLEPCSSLEVTVTFVPEIIGDRKESLVLKVRDIFSSKNSFRNGNFTHIVYGRDVTNKS